MRKRLVILVVTGLLLVLLAVVFALPWKGMSRVAEWREMRTGRIV